jgi:hypothetical protein
MVTFLIYSLAFIGLLTLIVLVLAVLFPNDQAAQRARTEMEIRRAQRQIHEIARNGLQAMLDEARAHEARR